MRDKIKNIVANILKNYKWDIDFYYDYIGITVYFNEIFSVISYVDIENLKDKLNSDNWWLEINQGNIKICYYINHEYLKGDDNE